MQEKLLELLTIPFLLERMLQQKPVSNLNKQVRFLKWKM
jgi:hypothetical protein